MHDRPYLTHAQILARRFRYFHSNYSHANLPKMSDLHVCQSFGKIKCRSSVSKAIFLFFIVKTENKKAGFRVWKITTYMKILQKAILMIKKDDIYDQIVSKANIPLYDRMASYTVTILKKYFRTAKQLVICD